MRIIGIIMEAGMSARPEYYSGYGITTSNLTSEHLQKIYTGILKFSKEKADIFVKAVAKMPYMSATAFLTNLLKLDSNEYDLSKMNFSMNDIEVGHSEGNGFGFLAALLTESNTKSKTPKSEHQVKMEIARENDRVRGQFLRQHSVVPDDIDLLKESKRSIDGRW